MLPRRLAAWLVAGALGVVRLAAAAHPLSDYEKESLRIGLDDSGSEVDPSPAGKVVEGVDVVTLDVIEQRDPAPEFLNWFHATSRPKIIEQDVLLRTGDRYDAAVVEETERNLRVLRQLSVVLIVPTKGSAADRVRLLVVTKDVWSLRLNWDPVFVNGALQSLYLQPSEENLLGRHKTLNGNILLGRATYSLGLGFIDPRIAGTRLQAAATGNVIVNCRTGKVEGSEGSFQYGKPLYSTRTKWSWVTAAAWSEGIVRPAGVLGQSICSDDRAVPLDFAATRERDGIPYQYRQDVLAGQVSATRSFGALFKSDVSFGLETDRRAYEPPDLSNHPQVVRDEFQALMPVSDTRISPFVQLHTYHNHFLRVLDMETMGLQEDYQLGHDVWLRAYPALRAVGSTRNLMGLYGGAAYTLPLADGLLRAYATTSVQLSRVAQTDGAFQAGARVVTPRLPFGRVVLDGLVLDRFDNYLNPTQSLGGTTRLRGYRTLAFVGPNVVVMNAELRTRSIEILHVYVGAVAFYDAGDAFRSFTTMKLRQGAGGGLRFAFPQIQRAVFRLDLGVPLNASDPDAETSIVAQFEQAFDVPQLASPGLVQ
ncbi:MAG TPA: BamA/TamA family outer membrane protein [Polyangiaceae bacterium]|nr:BamA/TamA family outer membrane protein [Polyangiaceae bacterium]